MVLSLKLATAVLLISYIVSFSGAIPPVDFVIPPKVVDIVPSKPVREGRGRADDGKIAEFSVKFYYTPEVKKEFKGQQKVFEKIREITKKTNEIFEDSKIPIRMIEKCPEKTSISESQGMYTLESFQKYKYRFDLLDTADAAALLSTKVLASDTDKSSLCGEAFVLNDEDNFSFAFNRLSITNISCGYKTFAHELGHNFGAYHTFSNRSDIPYGHGYYLPETTGTKGTIMTYASQKYIFSNPNIWVESWKNWGGDKKTADVARLIKERR